MSKIGSSPVLMMVVFSMLAVFAGCDVKQSENDAKSNEDEGVAYSFEEAWSREIPGGVDSSPNFGDIDGDGALEIIVCGRNGKIYAFHGNGDIAEGWPVRTGSYIWGAPAVGDLNGDGMLEVVVISNDGKLYALTGKGVSLPGWPLRVDFSEPNTGGSSPRSSPVLADVDGDKRLDIIYTSMRDENLIVLNHLGQALPGWPQRFKRWESTANTPAVGDIDGDGFVEIACGVNYSYSSESNHYRKLYVFNHDGTPVTGWPRKIEEHSWSGFTTLAFADINNDRALEIVFSSYQSVYVTDAAGEMLPWWPRNFDHICDVVIADLDGDQNLDIIVSDYEDGLYTANFRSVSLPGFLFNLVNSGFLAVADINHDNINDIVVAPYYPGHSYRAVTAKGTFLPGFSLVTGNTYVYTYASPLILDLNGDGGIDIIGTKNDFDGVNVTCDLFVWSSDAPFNPTLRGWPKFHYDPQNTGMVPVT